MAPILIARQLGSRYASWQHTGLKLVIRAYKTELDPNNKQRLALERFAEIRMFVYNIGLLEWERQYKQGLKPSEYGLKKQFNAAKDELFPFVRDAPYAVTEGAFNDLGETYKHFFRRFKNGDKKAGHLKPQRNPDKFALKNTRIERGRVHLTGIGWVRLKESGYLPTTDSGLEFGTYSRITKRAGRWFISVSVEEPDVELNDMHDTVIGIDFGIKAVATCSNGKVFHNPRPLIEADRKLKRLQRELARRKRGGANWNKTRMRLQRQHKRVSDIRKHFLHQISDYVVLDVRPSVIVIEDLNVSGMLTNHHLARAISDVGFNELRRQIEYKARWYGVDVMVADRWFPSSKTCHRCGVIKDDLKLSDRTFVCDECGLVIDRDLNAALNLAALGSNRQTDGDCLGS